LTLLRRGDPALAASSRCADSVRSHA